MDNDMFEIDIDNVNTEEIMKQIRQKIKDQGIVDEVIEITNNFDETDNMNDYINMVNSACNVIADKKITSHRKVIGKVIVFFKRAIRKCTHWYIAPIVEQQNEFNSYVTRTFNVMNEKIKQFEEKDKQLEEKYKQLEELERKRNGKLNFDYIGFENKYRGSQEEITKKLYSYVEYFENCDNVLDIGCGRGEFLEILKEKNISASGIDIEDNMVSMCKEKGLNVKKADALEYLNSLEDNSLGGIIINQVIEHMEPNYLIEVIKAAYRKLKPEAHFVAETINPQSMIVFTEAYFMDLSHKRMLHPYTVQFLLESNGFKEASIRYMNKVEDLRIPESDQLPEEINKALKKLNDVVYGYRDYAIIGRK